MDMDMEMDIPDPGELEWLENNALIPEEENADDYEFIVEEEFEGEASDHVRPPSDQSAHPEIQIDRKRPRPEREEAPEPSGTDKGRGVKRRPLELEEDESDEDWLHYSPPRDSAVAADSAFVMEDSTPVVSDERIVSRFASEIDGEYITVTGPTGDRVYAKLSSENTDGGKRKLIRENPAKGLLDEPISILINKVEQEALTKALEDSAGLPILQTHSTTPTVSEQLWVEKYAPYSFKELLSDEQTNREVLLWLKQWDSSVFGSQIRATTEDVLSALRRHSSALQKTISDRKHQFSKGTPFSNLNLKSSNVLERESINFNGISESYGKKSMLSYPLEQKVLLLCGPPGLGKTTLAHVAAKHCGYGVVEINASDDRSSSAFQSKILDVMEMKSVMGDSKPKCLVIDEIDGALGEGKGAVDVILKMVTAEKGKTSQEAQPGKASIKKGSKVAKLLRPIICICNDLYAPALRPLRQVAKVHTFVQPTVSRVVNRLKYICKTEGFRTSSLALSALAQYTECDIRSCLNTLQFLHKKKETLNILEVGSQVVGRKDMSRNAFDVWKEVFQKRKLKRSTNGCNSYGEFDFLYTLISNCGEHELTMNGIHENFLQLSYHDPMMQKTVRCLDVLGVSDTLLRYILQTQQMSLYAYQPIIAICMRYLIAQVEKPNIEWPKSLLRCRTMRMERKELLKVWHNKISPSISRHLTTESVVEDIVSPLLHILSPPTLRPVALHLLSEKEKDEMTQLVDTMVSYSLTYKNSKPESFQVTRTFAVASDAPVLSLDPPVDGFVNFKDYQSGQFRLSLAVKQILVHEVENQRILRESISRSVNHTGEINNKNQASPVVNVQAKAAINIITPVTFEGINTLKAGDTQRQKIANNAINSGSKKIMPVVPIKSKGPMDSKRPTGHTFDFFERFRKGGGTGSKNPGNTLQKSATMERDSRPLLFKYNEGFTNAVKRPMKIRELLL